MDNSNTPLDNQANTTPEPSTPNPIHQTPHETPKKPRNRLVVAAIAVLSLLLITLVPLSYVLGTMNAPSDQNSNVSTDISSTSDVQSEEEIEKTETPDIEEYNGWNTYKNSTYGYSFKYPAAWQVDRDIVQDSADWVSINPASEADSEGDVLAIYTYFDGTGCPNTKTKDFTIGGYTVEGTACVVTDVYKVNMKYSKQVGANTGASAIFTVAAPDLVGIQIDTSRGEGEEVQQILDSVTGLTPYGN